MKMRVETTISTLLLTLILVAASTIAPVIGEPNNNIVGKTKSAPAVRVSTASVTPGVCGPIDLAIVLDNTGSMFGAIDKYQS